MAEGRKHHRGRREKKKLTVGSVISFIVLIAAIGVFIYAAYNLYTIYSGRYKGDKEYNELKDLALAEEEDGRFKVDFEELWKINPDIKAWIRFDEPSIISYPVVQGKDNNEYLHRTISGFENTYGAIFINVDNSPELTDRNTIIYGHRMNSDSMFGQLDTYKEKEHWDKYPCFYIYQPDGSELKYQIFASGTVHQDSNAYQIEYADEADYAAYLDFIKESADYDTGVEVGSDAEIVTLSTCTKSEEDYRYVVWGVKVTAGE